MPRRRLRRLLGSILLAGAIGSAAYAFTASNTVPATEAGAAASAISGYTVSSVAYTLNGTDPRNIDSVQFTISPTSATLVKIQLVSSGTWYACTNTSGSVSCTTSGATVAGSTQLTVVATQ